MEQWEYKYGVLKCLNIVLKMVKLINILQGYVVWVENVQKDIFVQKIIFINHLHNLIMYHLMKCQMHY